MKIVKRCKKLYHPVSFAHGYAIILLSVVVRPNPRSALALDCTPRELWDVRYSGPYSSLGTWVLFTRPT